MNKDVPLKDAKRPMFSLKNIGRFLLKVWRTLKFCATHICTIGREEHRSYGLSHVK